MLKLLKRKSAERALKRKAKGQGAAILEMVQQLQQMTIDQVAVLRAKHQAARPAVGASSDTLAEYALRDAVFRIDAGLREGKTLAQMFESIR